MAGGRREIASCDVSRYLICGGRIPITISIRSPRGTLVVALWVACSFDREVAYVGARSDVVSLAICDVLPLMNSVEPASIYV